MATAHITFGGAMAQGAPVYHRVPNKAATITTSGTSQATTIEARQGDFAHITTTGNIFIAIGDSPTAASGSGDLVTTGTKTFGPLKDGDKVAVIDA